MFWTLCVTHLAEKAQPEDSTEERELPCPSTRSIAGECCSLEENSPQDLVKREFMKAAKKVRRSKRKDASANCESKVVFKPAGWAKVNGVS